MRNKICYITVGAPGCGKSTYANDIINKFLKNKVPFVHLNRDDIRHAVYGIFNSRENVNEYYMPNCLKVREKIVTNAINSVRDDAIRRNFNIIDSNTNMHANRLKETISMYIRNGYDVIVVSFLDIPLDEIKRRNRSRERVKQVPDAVIEAMARRANDVWDVIDSFGDKIAVINAN